MARPVTINNQIFKDRSSEVDNNFMSKRNIKLSYEECSNFLVKLGIKTGREFYLWYKSNKIPKIPGSPECYYKSKNRGWVSWDTF